MQTHMASFRIAAMKYTMYVGDVEWQKLKTALALKPSVRM